MKNALDLRLSEALAGFRRDVAQCAIALAAHQQGAAARRVGRGIGQRRADPVAGNLIGCQHAGRSTPRQHQKHHHYC